MRLRIDVKRSENEVRALEALPSEKGKVLLYGSSFFAKWGKLRNAQQMRGRTLCHGFGGSTGDEQLYYYARLVRPFAPKALVLRGGLNDLAQGYSPEEAFDMSLRVCEWARADFPNIKVAVMPSFDFPAAPSRPDFRQIFAYNALLARYAQEARNVTYLNLSPFFYESPALEGTFKGFRPVFVQDGLHLNDRGYEEFARYFDGILTELNY